MAITELAFNDIAVTRTWQLDGLDTNKRYDLVRVLANVSDSERRYSVVGWRRDWQPASGTVVLTDYQSPLRPFYLALYDSSTTTPIDWYFGGGEYGGPGPVMTGPLVTPADSDCGLILRSSIQPNLFVRAKQTGDGAVSYPVRAGEHAIIGAKYPVFVVDRRQGRSAELQFYTKTKYDSELMRELLLPDSGRVYPIWCRSTDDDSLLFEDLYFMPLQVDVQPLTKLRPEAKYWTVEATELDPRSILPRSYPDSTVASALPKASFTASPTTGKDPLTVTFTNTSVNATRYKWNFMIGSKKYGTSTSQNPSPVTYKERGYFTVRLTAWNANGVDITEQKIRVT